MIDIKELEKNLSNFHLKKGDESVARILFYRGSIVIQMLNISVHPVDKHFLKSKKLSSYIKRKMDNVLETADSFQICDVTEYYIDQFNNSEIY